MRNHNKRFYRRVLVPRPRCFLAGINGRNVLNLNILHLILSRDCEYSTEYPLMSIWPKSYGEKKKEKIGAMSIGIRLSVEYFNHRLKKKFF